MAKATVHVTHHFTVTQTNFYKVEIDIPNCLSESEAKDYVDYSEKQIRAMMVDGEQYDSSVGLGEYYDPYDGSVDFFLIDYEREKDAQEDPVSPDEIERWSNDRIEFNMIPCPEGEFWMGSDEAQLGYDWELPLKSKEKVTIKKGFLMGETQVTQALWERVMGWKPEYLKENANYPIANITWYDCLAFCNKLSKLEGLTPCFNLSQIKKFDQNITSACVEWLKDANGYRLPTEREWEYCAKAGTDLIYSGSNQIDEVAWYHDNTKGNLREVKTKKPNAWGLYDMSGNVEEWCLDEAHRSAEEIENSILSNHVRCDRIVRGGTCINQSESCQVSNRNIKNDVLLREDPIAPVGLRLLRDST